MCGSDSDLGKSGHLAREAFKPFPSRSRLACAPQVLCIRCISTAPKPQVCERDAARHERPGLAGTAGVRLPDAQTWLPAWICSLLAHRPSRRSLAVRACSAPPVATMLVHGFVSSSRVHHYDASRFSLGSFVASRLDLVLTSFILKVRAAVVA